MSITARPGVSVRTSWERLDSFLSVLGNQDAEILRADIASLLNDARPADGRMARSHQTRRAIVDAMRALHSEGDLRRSQAGQEGLTPGTAPCTIRE